jgi:hypothetical protein
MRRVSREVRELIQRMGKENPLWGAPRIHGELLKLGFEVAESTVSKLSFPKIRSGRIRPCEGESDHHPMRCLGSSTCLEHLSPTCSQEWSSRDSPDDSQTDFKDSNFLDCLEARRGVRTAAGARGSPDVGVPRSLPQVGSST